MTFAARPVEIVEIIQPLCSRTFGVSPCNATGDACWNTDKTCKFLSALDLSKSLTLRFVNDDVYEWQDNNINLLAENNDALITEGFSVTYNTIEFVGGATASKAGAASGTSTIALNSGLTGGIASSVSSGDFVIAVFSTGSTENRTLSITDGTNPYTLIGSELYADGIDYDTNLRIAYKFVTSDTSVTFGATGNTADAGAMAVYVFRNIDSTTPLDVSVTTATDNGSSKADPPSITPSTAGSFIVSIGAAAHTSGVVTFTSSDLTEFLTVGSNDDNDASLGIGHEGNWIVGAFDPAAFGNSISTLDDLVNSWAAMSIALRPSSTVNPPDSKTFLVDYYYQPALAIPALQNYQTAPTVLNVASGSRNKSPLGYRAVSNVRIKDFPWNDIGTDPYVSTRPYDPDQIGSFWTKWLARNPYHIGYTINIYEGLMGQPLSLMTRREYVIEKIDSGRNGVGITAKDILRKITDTNLTAPYLSTGELASNITNVATTMTVAGAILSDYPAAGYVKINNEVIQYTQRYETTGGNIFFDELTRGLAGTTAAAQSQNDRVQRVLYYNATPFHEILYDLLVMWGGIPKRYINLAEWALEKNTYRSDYNFTAWITDPNKIDDLLGEVCLQAVSNLWWDERVQKIIMQPVKPQPSPTILTEDDAIVAGSFTIEEKPEDRASQTYVYYLQRTPTPSMTEKTNYSRVAVFIDVLKQVQYGGEPQIRELFCRFIGTQAIANALAQTYLERFSDVRKEITFDISAKDAANIWTGSVVQIRHYLDVDFTGAPRAGEWLVTSAEVARNGLTYRFTAEDNEKGGTLWTWLTDAGLDANGVAQSWRWLDNDGKDSGGIPQPYRWL